MRVIPTSGYERRVRRLLKPEARAAAETAITARPDAWPVIRGAGGARKARVALPGRGKSGGARVIYFYAPAADLVAFFDIYAKSEKEDLTDADKQNLKTAIAEILAALEPDDSAG
jgi:hypothetical protein